MQDNTNGIASSKIKPRGYLIGSNISCYRLPGLGKYFNKVSMDEYSILFLKCDYRVTFTLTGQFIRTPIHLLFYSSIYYP